jgi:predicted site-specific integrase-resolvase
MIRMSDSRNLSTGEAALALDVTRNTLLRWMHQGIVTPVSQTAGGPLGTGHFRWNLDQLRQQLAEHAAEHSRPEDPA